MAYIGRQLVRGQNRVLDDISSSFNGSTTAFNLTVSSSSSPPASVNQLWIILGGVLQKPGTDFTVADAVLTFTTAPASTLSFWGMIQGDTSDINSPADASVTPSKIANSGDFAFPADVRFKDADGSHYVGLQAPSTVSSNLVWSLPAADGSANQLLKTDGSGNLGWASDTQSNLLDEDNMSSNSATQPASQQSIKAYADTKAVLTGSTDNTICTVTGANAIAGESSLTYDGSELKILKSTDALITLENTGNAGVTLIGDADRSGADDYIFSLDGRWNGTSVAAIRFESGADTTNKDDGIISFWTAPAGTKSERLRITSDGKVSIGTDTPHCVANGVHIKSNDSGVTSASVHRDDVFIEGSDHTGITIATPNNKTGGIGFDDPDGAGRGRLQYTHSSEKMQLYTSGTNSFEFTDDLNILDGNLVVANGHGIDFSTTGNGTGTTNSELFHDYEEGSFTPHVEFGSGGTTGMTLSSALGRYTKIGRVVRCDFSINFSAKGTSTGGVYIGSLPFTATDDSSARVTGIVPYVANVTSVSGQVLAYGGTPATRVPLYDCNNGSTILNQGNINNDTLLRGVITYNCH